MRRRLATLEFIEKCRAAESVADISILLFHEMEQCGVAYVACASHVDPLNPPPGAVSMVNYPTAWLERFSDRNYARRDPVFWAANATSREFWWEDFIRSVELERDQRAILSEAKECGVSGGLTIPLHAPGALPASCSLVPGPDGIDPLLMPDIRFMALHAHEEARLRVGAIKLGIPPLLSPRQRECLALVARGNTDKSIARVLGIAPKTAQHTIESAREKFGVSHRAQAVALAIMFGQITPADISD